VHTGPVCQFERCGPDYVVMFGLWTISGVYVRKFMFALLLVVEIEYVRRVEAKGHTNLEARGRLIRLLHLPAPVKRSFRGGVVFCPENLVLPTPVPTVVLPANQAATALFLWWPMPFCISLSFFV
jgi:hypothetical protein